MDYYNDMMLREPELPPNKVFGESCIMVTGRTDSSGYGFMPMSEFYARIVSKQALIILMVGEPIQREYSAYK